MNIVPLPAAAAAARSARPDRAATAMLHDSDDLRAVIFRLEPGQHVAEHTSPSTVALTVIAGEGWVSGLDGERAVTTADLVTYQPNEPHGMRAGETPMVLLATIAPRPGGR